jgi:hypothetical protein
MDVLMKKLRIKGKGKCCLLEKVEGFDKMERGMRSTVIG